MDRNEGEKQQSSLDRVNNALRGSNAIYQNRKRIKNAANYFRWGTQAVKGVSVTVWGVILTILLIIALTGLLSFFGGGGGGSGTTEAIVGGKTTCAEIGGTCQATACTSPYTQDTGGAVCTNSTNVCCVSPGVYACPSGNYPACLLNDFNVVVNGNPSAAFLKYVFNAYAFASKASRFRALLMNGGSTLYLDRVSVSGTSCTGVQVGANRITINDGDCTGYGQDAFTRFLIHESGHIIAARNSRVYQSYPHSVLSSSDSSCYQYSSCGSDSGYFMETYFLRYYCPSYSNGCISINAKYESFAEAIANYLYPKNGYSGNLCSITISNFKTSCSNAYSWLKDNIYGGYTFY